MFCDRCGASVPPNQRFCGNCGKELVAGAVLASPSRGRVEEHARLLGILWLALSALNAVGGLLMLIVANTIFAHGHEFGVGANVPSDFLHVMVSAIGGLILVKAAASLFAGWGLLRHEPWARMLTIVLSFLALFNIPFGTILGVYGLWVLLPSESEREYEIASQRIHAA